MSDIIRRRALMANNRNAGAHECVVEYEFPNTNYANYSGQFGPMCITNVNWPEGITEISSSAFYGSKIDNDCFNSIPNSVSKIGRYAFAGCQELTNITLPPNLSVCGQNAFYYCYNISTITLPETSCVFWNSSLYGCNRLATINTSDNTLYAFMDNPLTSSTWLTTKPSGNVYLGKNYYYYKGSMPSNTDLTLEPGTLSIAGSAFSSKSQLKSISIPDTVQFIGYNAFNYCTGLTEITIPKSLNGNLYNNSVQNIYYSTNSSSAVNGESAIYFCNIFSSCTGITTLNYNAINGYGGNNGSISYCLLGGSSGLPNLTTFNFGPEVEVIPKYLCNDLKKITSITIPSSVKHISSYAFYKCTALTSITIPETVESLDSEGYIFSGCTGITTLNYNAINAGRRKNLESPIINTTSGIWAASNVTTINIGNQVQTIPGGLLNGLTKVTSITIPSSVTRLDYGAFYSSKVTAFDIPSSVTSIGNYAFYANSSMTSVTIRATTPPTLDANYSSTFPDTSQSFTIKVPSASVNTYKTATGWSKWASKIQAIPS